MVLTVGTPGHPSGISSPHSSQPTLYQFKSSLGDLSTHNQPLCMSVNRALTVHHLHMKPPFQLGERNSTSVC
jgi:hypothetical protein